MLSFVTAELVVGQAARHGRPGGADRTARGGSRSASAARCGCRRDAAPRLFDLDLRKPTDRARSVLFHRLRVLGLDWIRPAESEVQGRGTFRETWQSQWRPEYALALVEAATWGTTVAGAATAKILDAGENLRRPGTPAWSRRPRRSNAACWRNCRMPCGGCWPRCPGRRRWTPTSSISWRPCRRWPAPSATETSATPTPPPWPGVSETLVIRICAALKPALIGLDADSARAMRQRIDRVHAAVSLVSERRRSFPRHESGGWTRLTDVLERRGHPPRDLGSRAAHPVRRRASRRRHDSPAPGALVRLSRAPPRRPGSTGSSPTERCS